MPLEVIESVPACHQIVIEERFFLCVKCNAIKAKELSKMRQMIDGFDYNELFSKEW